MSVRERFINSIEYLRKLGFFEEYSDLTPDEILERIMGKHFLKEVDEDRHWVEKSSVEIDTIMAYKDKKRTLNWYVEISLSPGFAIRMMNELAGISRGIFQPTNMREEWLTEKSRGCNVIFTYRSKEYLLPFLTGSGFLRMWHVIDEINKMIEDTGYQYYEILGFMDEMVLVLLTEKEAEKLIKERGWRWRVQRIQVKKSSIHEPLEGPYLRSLVHVIIAKGTMERVLSSIEYLIDAGFFEEYSNLPLREIFEKIRETNPFFEDFSYHEEPWMTGEDKDIDIRLLSFYHRRVFVTSTRAEDLGEDIWDSKKIGKKLLTRLAEISRKVFQPTDIEQKWLEDKKLKVYFTFRGKRYGVVIDLEAPIWIRPLLRLVNSLIKETEYQYYRISCADESFMDLVVLTKEEAERLTKERGWTLSCEW